MRIGLPLASLAVVLALPHPVLAQTCGDGAATGGEECDDANAFGGDGCAANCTLERELTCALAQGSMVTQKAQFFAIPSGLGGQVVLTVGGARADLPMAPVPFVVRAAGAHITPTILQGLRAISCNAVAEIPGWGPGNAGGGLIDCGATRLGGIDVNVTIDHNAPATPPVVERGGMGPMGSVIVDLGMSTYTVADNAPGCASQPGTGPLAFGPDAIPCTADDPSRLAAQAFSGSSGEATARVLNVNGGAGMVELTASGQPLDCAQLDGASPLTGTVLVAAAPLLDVPQAGDVATTVALVCGAVAPVATPTARIIPTCAPTPTWTSTPGTAATPTVAPTGTPPPPPTGTATPTGAVATVSPSASSMPTAPPTATAPAHTATPTALPHSPTPTGEATQPEATATPPPSAPCAGDCNGDVMVTVDELVRAVNIALGSAALTQCPAIDFNGDGSVGIDELIRAVNNALQGCPR